MVKMRSEVEIAEAVAALSFKVDHCARQGDDTTADRAMWTALFWSLGRKSPLESELTEIVSCLKADCGPQFEALVAKVREVL
jgi:hypothetical protein